MDTAVEHPTGIVPADDALQVLRKSRSFRQSVHVDGVEVMTTVWFTLQGVALIGVRLGTKIPSVCGWIDDSRTLFEIAVSSEGRTDRLLAHRDSDHRIDVHATIKIRSQEGDVHISLSHQSARLAVELVKVVLSGRNEHILDAVV